MSNFKSIQIYSDYYQWSVQIITLLLYWEINVNIHERNKERKANHRENKKYSWSEHFAWSVVGFSTEEHHLTEKARFSHSVLILGIITPTFSEFLVEYLWVLADRVNISFEYDGAILFIISYINLFLLNSHLFSISIHFRSTKHFGSGNRCVYFKDNSCHLLVLLNQDIFCSVFASILYETLYTSHHKEG